MISQATDKISPNPAPRVTDNRAGMHFEQILKLPARPAAGFDSRQSLRIQIEGFVSEQERLAGEHLCLAQRAYS